jgi:CheY-like chemotaxis protein
MKKVSHVLIVDDDATSSFLIAATLEELGIASRISKVYNGRQALDFLEANYSTSASTPEEPGSTLILLDLNMPVMNGFEFLDEFSLHYTALESKVNICILSSSVSPRDLTKARQYNIAGFITKPLAEENLLPILDKI